VLETERNRASVGVFYAFDTPREWGCLTYGLGHFDLIANRCEDGGEIGLQLREFALEHMQKRRESFGLLPQQGQFIFVRHASLLGLLR
jgi:hypothetical protein